MCGERDGEQILIVSITTFSVQKKKRREKRKKRPALDRGRDVLQISIFFLNVFLGDKLDWFGGRRGGARSRTIPVEVPW